jgi:hypothetical protein
MKKKSTEDDQKRPRKSVNFMIDEDEFLAHQNQSSYNKLNDEHNMKNLLKKDVSPSSILKRRTLESQENLLDFDSNHSGEASKQK